jgi:DNA-binding beta-propeller fold protein YncE
MRRTLLPALAALALLGWAYTAGADTPASGYHVVKTIHLGGKGGWDYLTMDPDAHRLYIARSDRVQVLDVDSGKLVGEVAHTPGVHGVALVPRLKKGYASNGRDSTVTIFDLETLAETARPKVGEGPDAILYDPASERVFTFNGRGHDATAIDVARGNVAGSVKLGGKPETAVSDEKGTIYVNIEDKSEIVAFDAKDLTVKHRWPLAPGKEPTGLAIDRERRRLFSSCHNQKMVVLDADSGKVLADAAIGRGTDACVFDPGTNLAFSSNGDGTLTVVEAKGDEFRVADNVKTQRGARTMALDPRTHTIYLATARFKAPEPGQRRPGIEPDSFVILVVGK